MPKKIITLVEDEEYLRTELKKSIEDVLEDTIEVKCFATGDEFHAYSQTDDFKQLVRASIFDLANTDAEASTLNKSFSISKYIAENYNNVRAPIIIYSAFVSHFDDFKDYGTVFKIEKSGTSVDELCDLLELMKKTGFLEVFSANGILESRHPQDLHDVFTSQFKGAELKQILTLLHTCHGDECVERVTDVFQRMALRALVNKLNSAQLVDGKSAPLHVNVIEHFYRRTNLDITPIWTGDILEHKATGDRVYIMRPKCDLAWITPEDAATLNVLICPILTHTFKSKTKEVGAQLKHNPSLGLKTRIIPPSIFYPKGGKYPDGSAVDFANPTALPYLALINDYNYLVTLSDDFINEIATRFGAYLVRPGITDIDPDETTAEQSA
jgi:hypothetical protein